jgi:solute carrier family 8 (sodium/calcium exchanger)
LCHFF